MVRTSKMLILSACLLTLTLVVAAILVLTASHDATAGSTPPVTTTADSGPGSLRMTIAGASASETISFDPSLAGQTITLTTGPITIAKNLTIAGPDGGITVSGNNSSRVFEVTGAVNVHMTRVHLTHGSYAAGSGGAIDVQALANLTFENGSIKDSRTTASFSAGGAVSVQSNANATLNNVEISGNTSASFAAGVHVAGNIYLTNVTISENVASGTGAGLVLRTPSEEAPAAFAYLVNVTITNNPAGGANGAAVFVSGAQALATLNLTNTIVADQAVGGDCFLDVGGVINSLSHNIDSDGTCNLGGGAGDQPSTDPMLQPLALNPPGTTRTHAIGPGSPAFNHGDDGPCPATDQREVMRPQGTHCDVGAYEAMVATPTPTPNATPTTTATPPPSPSPSLPGTATPTGGTTTPTPMGQTPTTTPPPDGELVQGDNDCDDDSDAVDALKGLQHVAAIPFAQEPECPDVGAALPATAPAGEPPDVFGDVDCDGDVDAVDALKILQFVAAIPFTQDEPCVDIGDVF